MNDLTTPWGFAYLQLRCRMDRARANPDRGASAIEWVIITAVLVAIAAAVGLVIYNLVVDKANEHDVPDAPGGGGGGGGGAP